jgi:D-galactonate transporter
METRMAEDQAAVSPHRDETQLEAATYRKITIRLMPFLFLCYLLAYVDRVNLGFAKLQMQSDLALSDTVFGLGAGIFFIGYFLFEVPANMMLRRLGARRWIGPIMIVWGLVSACTAFVHGAYELYAVRFCLGIVESGFFPGVILYLTFWYTRTHRAKMVAAFMCAIPFSSVAASPVSGWILARMSGAGGLSGWQWLFLTEGVPSLIAGVIALYYLPDGPHQASWLEPAERDLALRRLAEEEDLKRRAGAGAHRIRDVFRSRAVWLMCLIYFGVNAANYGLTFWMPQVIKETISADPRTIGWLLAVPWGCATVAMLIAGRHSDMTGERRWHTAAPILALSAALLLSAIPGIPGAARLAALTLATMGITCAYAVFWALPTSVLSGAAAAAGIAWINSVGNLSGFAGPYLVGFVRDRTHGSMFLALMILSLAALIAGLAALRVAPRRASGSS